MRLALAIALVGFAIVWPRQLPADEPVKIEIDCRRQTGVIRPLQGVNGGTLHAQDTLDLAPEFREMGSPLARLHDCHWPNADVVDIHVLFPNFDADPNLVESYDFRRTDEYLTALTAAGCDIVFRLGESIEHTKTKIHVNPPPDPEKWATICLEVVRHYVEQWHGVDGHRVRYWEIWNEPENRPAMWTGDDEQFLKLYAATAKRIKKAYPHELVGGPGFGYVGEIEDGKFKPTPLLAALLRRCKDEDAPLDFLSWHCYAADPRRPVALAQAVRKFLDESGFRHTESHLSEWSYLPDNNWGPVPGADRRAQQAWFDRQGGPEGAAYSAAVLMLLQDAPVDVANFYSADTQGFGMFSEHGAPKKAFYAFKAFAALKNQQGLQIVYPGHRTRNDCVALASLNGDKNRIKFLVSNIGDCEAPLEINFANLPWSGKTMCDLKQIDAERNLEAVGQATPLENGQLQFKLPPKSVGLGVISEAPRHD